MNPFGAYAASPEAQDFITQRLTDELEVEQFVVNLTAVGSFDVLSGFLDGPVGYAAGVEYRDESSDNRLDPLTLGILPQGTSFTPGLQVSEVSPWLFGFTSFDNTQQFNTSGDYDVTDVFAEIRLPIFADRAFARELTIDAAVRQADYSTLGEATSYKFGAHGRRSMIFVSATQRLRLFALQIFLSFMIRVFLSSLIKMKTPVMSFVSTKGHQSARQTVRRAFKQLVWQARPSTMKQANMLGRTL